MVTLASVDIVCGIVKRRRGVRKKKVRYWLVFGCVGGMSGEEVAVGAGRFEDLTQERRDDFSSKFDNVFDVAELPARSLLETLCFGGPEDS